jgi:hypothetical protein
MKTQEQDGNRSTRTILLLVVVLVVLSGVTTLVTLGAEPVRDGSAPASAAPHLLAQNTEKVNPFGFYQQQPAPVGIADYGIGPGDAPYEYSSSAFLGGVSITRLQINSTATGTAAVGLANQTLGNSTPVQVIGNTFLPVNALGVTFQLNVVMSFVDSGKLYVYWLQDVAGLVSGACSSSNPVINLTDSFIGCTGNANDATNGTISFEDNVWNFSAPEASMTASTISSSNGSTSSTDGIGYYAASATTQPGNYVLLNYPSLVQFRVYSIQTAAHLPEAVFQYSDGHGWQTFDNPTFPFATNVSQFSGIVVNGFTPNPWGLFYDSELTVGGAGDGTYSGLGPATNMYFTLQYWNGHNYESVPNAYNFGSDTAESVKYVAANRLFGGADGQIGNKILGGTVGPLKISYDLDLLATLTIDTTIPSGTVKVGSLSEAFVGGSFTQNIGPTGYGSYKLLVDDPATIWSQYVTIKAEETLTFNTVSYHSVTFKEKGLPSGAVWSISLGASTDSASAKSIVFYVLAGSYSYTPGAPTPYTASGGTVPRSSSAQTIVVQFTAS